MGFQRDGNIDNVVLEHNFLKKIFQISLAYSMVSVDSVDSVDTVKQPLTRFVFFMSYRDDNLQQEFDSDDDSKIHVLDEL